MNKVMKLKKLKLFLLIISFIVIFTGCISNKFEISDTKASSDLIGTKLGLLTDKTISKDDLKSLDIIDKSVDAKSAKVIVNVDIQYTDKGKGALNKYHIKNDIQHNLSGELTLNYAEYDKEWRLENVTNIEKLNHEEKEIETSIEEISFKNEEQVYDDLKANNVGIPIIDNISETLTLGENKSMGYETIKEVKEFKLLDVKQEKDSPIYKYVTIYLDADFEVNDKDNMHEENGEYNTKGEFTAIYILKQDEEGNPSWNFSSIKSFSSEFKTTKI